LLEHENPEVVGCKSSLDAATAYVPYAKPMSVIIRPVGGLGNQLFIYSAGRALAAREKTTLHIDRSYYVNNDSRLFELDSFEAKYLQIHSRQNIPRLSSSRFISLASRLKKSVFGSLSPEKVGLEEAFIFSPLVAEKNRPTMLHGYFQSWRYFDDLSLELRSELRSISDPSDWFFDISTKMSAAGPSVGLHVRRGDYLTNPYMGVVSDAYYEAALRRVKSLVGAFHIYVFSDDIESLSSSGFLSSWKPEVSFVKSPESSRPIESINLMSQCDHFVMANSSFSWWGAWLGDTSGKLVIYPRPWLAGSYVDDRDLALPHWMSLGDNREEG